MCNIRRRYVQIYADSLQQSCIDKSILRNIEKDLDPKIILLWRFLARAKAESVKSREASEEKFLRKRSWFPLRWRNNSEDDLPMDSSYASETVEGKFTKEEWEAVNKLLSYQPDEDLIGNTKDMHKMIHYMVTISISKAAARIVSIQNIEIVCGSFRNLCILMKFMSRSTCYDVKLQYYGFTSTEGSLAESVSSKLKRNALQASFLHTPVGENVCWTLSATIAPCYVTVTLLENVLIESYKRFSLFTKRSNAISPTIALETATALQNRIGKVTRKAQEQLQMVLEEHSRKIFSQMVKAKVCILVFIYLEEIWRLFFFSDDHSKGLTSSWSFATAVSVPSGDFKNSPFLIDRCGMGVIVDQIKVPHPNHPSTRISVEILSLGVHFLALEVSETY